MTPPTLFDHALVFLLAVALPLVAVFRTQPRMKSDEIVFDTATRIGTYWANSALLCVAALAVGAVWHFSGRPLADLGLRLPDSKSWPWTAILVAGFALLYAIDCWTRLRTPAIRARTIARWRRDAPFLPESRRELGHFLVLALSAGVCEEVIYRAYLISYLGFFTGETFLGLAAAVLVPAVVFGLSHLYQGWSAVVRVVAMAILFGAIFVLGRSLVVIAVAHVLVDIVGGLLAVRYLGAGGSAARTGDSL